MNMNLKQRIRYNYYYNNFYTSNKFRNRHRYLSSHKRINIWFNKLMKEVDYLTKKYENEYVLINVDVKRNKHRIYLGNNEKSIRNLIEVTTDSNVSILKKDNITITLS